MLALPVSCCLILTILVGPSLEWLDGLSRDAHKAARAEGEAALAEAAKKAAAAQVAAVAAARQVMAAEFEADLEGERIKHASLVRSERSSAELRLSAAVMAAEEAAAGKVATALAAASSDETARAMEVAVEVAVTSAEQRVRHDAAAERAKAVAEAEQAPLS